jgi:hypothetical protein
MASAMESPEGTMRRPDRYVASAAAKALVRGREVELLRTAGVDWPPRDGASHRECPYPFHDDNDPSWRLLDNGKAICTCCEGRAHSVFDVLVHLGLAANYEEAKLVAAQLLGREDLISEVHPTRSRGCTLADYAEAKQLPIEYLHGLGLKDTHYVGDRGSTPAVEIPYWGADGSVLAPRFRVSLTAKKKILSEKGARTALYGQWRLSEALQAGHLILVGGESDAQTLWLHGYHALGLPGEANWRDDRDAALLDGIPRIFALIEPDRGGEAMVGKLQRSIIAPRVAIVRMPPETKDASALYLADPGNFRSRLDALGNSAIPLPLPTAGKAAEDIAQSVVAPKLDAIRAEYPFDHPRRDKYRYGVLASGEVWVEKNLGDENKPVWVLQCTPITAAAWIAQLNDERSTGLRVALRDRDGERRDVDIAREFSGRKGNEILDRLTRAGLRLAGSGDHKGGDAVLDMLRYAAPSRKIDQLSRSGWHHLLGHAAPVFACPSGEVIGAPEGAMVELAEVARLPERLRRSGDLQGWTVAVDRIGRLRETPAYWVLGLCGGLAGPLLQLLAHPTCGCCVVGQSSIGKTLALEAATSMFAAPELTDRGLLTSADATPGAVEAHAERATGATLALDELRLVRPDQLAQIVHNLASDSGRSRLTRDSGMGMARAWSCFVLMSSERSVRQIIEDAGQRTKVTAGIVVRIADISVPGVIVPPEEVRAIRDGLRANFGWAGPAFVARLVEEGLHADPQALRELLARTVAWISGDKASPIEQRAAEPLALALMAGLLAQRFKLLSDTLDLKGAIANLWKQFRESDSAAALNPLDEAVDNLRHAVRSKLDISIKKLPLAQERNNRDAEGFYDDNAVYLSKEQLGRMSGMGPGEVARELHRRGMLIKGPGRYLLQPYVKCLGAVPSYALSRLHFGNTSEVVTEESLRREAEQHQKMVDELVRQADEIARFSHPQEASP